MRERLEARSTQGGFDAEHVTSQLNEVLNGDDIPAAFDDAVREASAGGASTRAIAEACGLSHQRVWQIINGK